MDEVVRLTVNLEEMAAKLRVSLTTLREWMRRHPDFPVLAEGRSGVPWQLDPAEVIAFIEQKRGEEAASKAQRDDLLAQMPLPMEDLLSPEERGLSGFSKIKANLDKASGVADWGWHDLRRTARTGLSRLGVPREAAEAALNHISGRAGLVGVYDRHNYRDEALAALRLWQGHVAGVVRRAGDQIGLDGEVARPLATAASVGEPVAPILLAGRICSAG